MVDKDLVNDFDKMRFHIHHHWWWRDLDEPKVVPFEAGLTFQNNAVLMTLDNRVRVPKAMSELDVLYITDRTREHPKSILNQLKLKRVVLSANLDWKTRSYWEQLLKERAIPYHDMRSEGAFVLSNYGG